MEIGHHYLGCNDTSFLFSMMSIMQMKGGPIFVHTWAEEMARCGHFRRQKSACAFKCGDNERDSLAAFMNK